MSVPADRTPVTDSFVCNGVPVSGNWTAPTGTGALAGSGYTTFNKSIVVGYMTTDWYEGAILKKDLW